MNKIPLIGVLVLLFCSMSPGARSAERMQFWNLTGTTITKLYLAPVGTTKWGSDQCANDKDGSVDPDERLKLTGVSTGHYDIKLTDVKGRTCIARDVAIDSTKAYSFSLSEADLQSCSK